MMKKKVIVLPVCFLSLLLPLNPGVILFAHTTQQNDSASFFHYRPGAHPAYSLLNTATDESLYVQIVHSNEPGNYLNFLARYPDSYFAVLAASRYLLLELKRGSQLPILINNLNEIGFSAHLVSLYPLIRGKPEHLKKAVIFPDHKIRMILQENYSGQLTKDPQLEWYLDFDKFVEIPFDALHLAARKNYFRIQGDHIQYLMADSMGLQAVLKVFNRINLIMDDLSRKIGYSSTSDLFSKILDRQYLMFGKLTVFVYNAQEFQTIYQLRKSGWSYPLNGQIYIDPEQHHEQDFLKQLIHQISHIFIAGNLYDIHHSACRWFDEGFARWSGHCYTSYQTLLPDSNSFQQTLLEEYISQLRLDAKEIWLNRKKKKIKFSSLNKQLLNYKNPQIQAQAQKLSLSLIAYLVETFGSQKLLKVAERVSHIGQNYSERSMYYILGWEYSDIQKGWNEWLSQEVSKLPTVEKQELETE